MRQTKKESNDGWLKRDLPVGQKVKTEDGRILTVYGYTHNAIGFTGDGIEKGEASWIHFSHRFTSVMKTSVIIFKVTDSQSRESLIKLEKIE